MWLHRLLPATSTTTITTTKHHENAQFLVGVTEALCYSGKLARSGLAPGLHTAAGTGSRPTSPSSVSSAAACHSRSNSGSCTSAGKGENCDGGGGSGGMSDADVAGLRGAAALMVRTGGWYISSGSFVSFRFFIYAYDICFVSTGDGLCLMYPFVEVK